MTKVVTVILAIGAGLTLYLIWLLLRYPHLRRMAWRSMQKQRRSMLLTVIGLAISTSFISMTLITNSVLTDGTKSELIRLYSSIAYDIPSRNQAVTDDSYFDLETIREIRQHTTDVSLPIMSLPATYMTKSSMGAIDRLSPYVNTIGVDEAEAVRFEPTLSAVLGSGLQRNDLLLSFHAAERLGAKAGDTVYVIDNSNSEIKLTVTAVVPEQGLTGYPGIYHGKGTALVNLDTARALEGVQGTLYTNLLLAEPPPAKWEAVPVRDNFVKDRQDVILFLTIFIGIVSLNAILIGIVLITNIFRLIAEERRNEWGILRTVGLSKSDVGRLMMIEGLLLGIFSGAPGVLLGLVLAYFLLVQITASFNDLLFLGVNAHLHLDISVAFSGLSVCMLIVFICVKLIAGKIANLSVVEAMRPVQLLQQPEQRHGILKTWVLITSSLYLLGCSALIAVPDIRSDWITDNRLPLIIAMLFLSLPVLVWVIVQLLPILGKGILLVCRNQSGLTLMMRLALRNMNTAPLRTGLLLFMFAVVSCFLSFSILYSHSIQIYMNDSNPIKLTGGHELAARVWRPLYTESVLRHMKTSKVYEQIKPFQLSAVQQLFWKQVQGPESSFEIKVNGIDGSFAESNDIPLLARDSRYASDREAWRGLATSDEAVILANNLQNYTGGKAYRIGESFPITVGDRTVSKTIIAIAGESGYQSQSYGIWLNTHVLMQLAKSERDIHSTVFIKLGSQADKDAIEKISQLLALQNISPVKDVVESENSYYQTMIFIGNVVRIFTIAALGIGMIGLIVVLYRLVHQRSRFIGILYTIGIRPETVLLSLLLEGFFIGSLGLATGFLVGTSVSYVTFNTLFSIEGIAYSLPILRILAYFSTALAFTLALSFLPARKALLVSPMEATRTSS
ncbi:ABC transporter permease [Paenibacillus silviterrae]|uniref:ABC transporter permease n=1 Tax=Paenibacillus silviterrae TaxID=3242194 RepID=UPI0025433031|nr:ABC transporter permease [Paenibacillus chinjuensis]